MDVAAPHEASELDAGLIKNLLLSYNPSGDVGLIDRAYAFSRTAHAGQKRQSGEPYIVHPVEVATILAEHRFDAITLAGALLHDVIEDCRVTEADIEREFGHEIAEIVAGVTKISSISPQTRQETQAENLRRMLVAVARDVRVLLIKLADRLHNMRTIDALTKEQVERLSRETLEIYAPLADRMGMSTVRAELEDLAFRHLEPEQYRSLQHEMEIIVGRSADVMRSASDLLEAKLKEAGVAASVTSRTKEVYSVRKKMLRQERPLREIFDLMAMRILVASIKDCYAALGTVHTLWKPIPRRFKDYIAMPKPNMYQALHTTVIGPGERPLEIQIKTHQMHLVAEEGIAAHWKYKSSGPVDERLGWLKTILEWQRDAVSAKEFMDLLKTDLYSDQVFVLTPKGDIKELPAGSSSIDLAYHIHTEVGNHLSGARVDGRLVPITSPLRSGAVVEIITSPTARPSRDWLDVVKSPRARQKIRYFLREKDADGLRKHGASVLQEAIDRERMHFSVAQKSEELERCAKQMGYADLDALVEAIGFGTESTETVVRKLQQSAPKEEPRTAARAPQVIKGPAAVVVEGVKDMLVRFAGCCNPVPGDPIIGYMSRGRGVTVHRSSCPSLAGQKADSGRFVDARWASAKGSFIAGIRLESEDRIGLLADITQTIAREKGNIISAEIKTKGLGRDIFLVEVDSSEHLDRLLAALKAVPGMRRVERA